MLKSIGMKWEEFIEMKMNLREFLGWLLFGIGYLGTFVYVMTLLGTTYQPYFSTSSLIVGAIISVTLFILGLSMVDKEGE